ncbi:MAG: hypothetical protein HC897_13560, partial [Thermoanaerobaculia bacterium]|nr:hypothetical protein [Thermoanaerobaculia bacterium]
MSLARDLRYGVRALSRTPSSTVLIVLMLALGIGATTAMFSIVHGVVLRPLPFSGAERLLRLCETHASVEGFCVASAPNAADWQRESRTLEQIGLAREWSFFIATGGAETELAGALATPEYFKVFRIEPLAGRLLEPADLAPGAPQVMVLGHALWQNRFAGEPSVIGRPLSLDGEPAT